VKKSIGLALALVAGCSSNLNYKVEDHIEVKEEKQKTSLTNSGKCLEKTLFEDASDGRLDMDFEKALFVASGCEDFVADCYKKEMDKFVEEIVGSSKNEKDDLGKARSIAKEIKDKTKYKLFEYRIHYLANKGIRQGNCLGLTILFNLACEKARIKSGFMNNLTHSFPYVEINGKKTYLDLTTDDLAPDKSDLEDEFVYEPSKLDIVAQIYCIKAASLSREGKLEEANLIYKKGLRINPKNTHILENLVKMNEFLNDGEACKNMDLYIKAYPEIPQLYVYKARILLRLEKYEDALSFLNKSLELKKDSEVEDWIKEIRKEHLKN